MIVWLLNKLFATGDVREDISEDLPYEIGERVGGGNVRQRLRREHE